MLLFAQKCFVRLRIRQFAFRPELLYSGLYWGVHVAPPDPLVGWGERYMYTQTSTLSTFFTSTHTKPVASHSCPDPSISLPSVPFAKISAGAHVNNVVGLTMPFHNKLIFQSYINILYCLVRRRKACRLSPPRLDVHLCIIVVLKMRILAKLKGEAHNAPPQNRLS